MAGTLSHNIAEVGRKLYIAVMDWNITQTGIDCFMWFVQVGNQRKVGSAPTYALAELAIDKTARAIRGRAA